MAETPTMPAATPTSSSVRPLFPWDAWMQWGTKARVWFELRTMAPFVTASEWLQATGPNVYFDAAPHYPATVPLLRPTTPANDGPILFSPGVAE